MLLQIELPERTVRKMRALAVLQENDSADFLGIIAEYIDSAVTAKIADAIGCGHSAQAQTPHVVTHMTHMARTPHTSGYVGMVDSQEIADGLSSERFNDDEEELPSPLPTMPKAPPAKPAPKAATISLKDVEQDNTVTDPEHEAVSPDNLEMSFAEAYGLDSEPNLQVDISDPEENPYKKIVEIPETKLARSTTPKKLPKNVKARVSEFTGGEQDSF